MIQSSDTNVYDKLIGMQTSPIHTPVEGSQVSSNFDILWMKALKQDI